MRDTSLRLRALLDEQFAVVAILLVVLVLLGGWGTYLTYTNQPTTTEERTVSSWQTTGSFDHSATVTENNSVYPVGTTHSNRSVYFTRISPHLDGTYAFAYEASDGGDVDATVSLEYVLRGIEGREETTVLWRTTRQLENISVSSLEEGEPVEIPFSIDMNRTVNRTEIVDEELDGPSGQPELVIEASVHLEGTVNGESIDNETAHTLPVELDGGAYRPAPAGDTTEVHESTRTVSVEGTHSPLRRFGLPALFAVSLFAFGGLVVARQQGRLGLSETERERLYYEDDRDDFDEWISTIRLPEEALGRPRAEADSLGALVDFAIDTDESVIEDPERNAYYVLHDEYLYTYQPPADVGE
jgi:hypothetical protein